MQSFRLCHLFDQVSFRCCDPDILVNNFKKQPDIAG